jgi:O-antigen ligase
MKSSALNRTDPGRAPLDRTRTVSALTPRRRSSVWLILFFALLGMGVAVGISFLAGSTPYGVLLIAGGLLLAIPLSVLMVRAIPQGIVAARVLKRNWTWWHPLWFLIFFSMLVFRIRDVDAAKANPLDAWAMTRVLPEAFVSMSLIIRLLLKKPNWLRALFTGIPGIMAVYCIICVISSAWSVNASWTAYKSLEFLADVSLMASIVASAESSETFQSLLDWTLTFYGLSLVGVWINLPIWPTEAMDGGRLTGVLPVEASNSVGTSGAVLALIAVCRLLPTFSPVKNRAWYVFLFIFGTVSMALSQTRNAEGACFLGIVLVSFFSKPLRRIAIVGTLIAAPLLAVAPLVSSALWNKTYEVVLTFAERDQSSGALDSLSGRTAWWAYGMEQLSKHPFTGLGAYAAGRFAVLNKLGVGAAAMMHNDWIEVLIGTSFWGLIPFALALLAAWWFLFRGIRSNVFTPQQRQLALECFALLGMLTLHSFFNDELSWHCPLLYFAILAYAEYARTHWKSAPVPQVIEWRTWQLDKNFSPGSLQQ